MKTKLQCLLWVIFLRWSQRFTGIGKGHYTHAKYMCVILVDWKFIAQVVRSQVTELRDDFLCLKMRLRKNFSTKRGSFGQFLIRIRIQDLDPDPNPGFESGFESGSDSKLTAGRIRIRYRIRNFCFGSATIYNTVLSLYVDSYFMLWEWCLLF